jgi:multisubunit Na+/H+ antiporter MnhF subunit
MYTFLDLAQDKIIVANTTMTIVAVVIAFAAYWTGIYVYINIYVYMNMSVYVFKCE